MTSIIDSTNPFINSPAYKRAVVAKEQNRLSSNKISASFVGGEIAVTRHSVERCEDFGQFVLSTRFIGSRGVVYAEGCVIAELDQKDGKWVISDEDNEVELCTTQTNVPDLFYKVANSVCGYQ